MAGISGRPQDGCLQGVPRVHDGWAVAPRDSGGEHNAWAWGSRSGCMEAGKAGPLTQVLGSSLTLPAMAKNSQQTSIYSPASFQTLSSSYLCVSSTCLSIPLSIHLSMGPPICPPYIYPFSPSSCFITSFKEETA